MINKGLDRDRYCHKCVSNSVGVNIDKEIWNDRFYMCPYSNIVINENMTTIPKRCPYKLEILLKEDKQ
jgi:uncharacterized protein YdeI (BOF family)